ncbi:MAG: chromosome partition protein MukE [Planctomycetes bacterium]|nr:chromosome partition protein MukE [Planctomycetota bacterium]
MTGSSFPTLLEALGDDEFPGVDLALRRGRHIGREDGPAYEFLVEALDHLEPFYRRFGCELVQRSDGFFFLLPSGDALGQRHLSAGEMLVGQTLALLYLDPATLAQGGRIARRLLLERLSGLIGAESLFRTLNPRRRKFDERVAAETVRTQVSEALRGLSALGFVDLEGDDLLRLRPALLRFADPVRGLSDPVRGLEQLVARGEAVLAEAQKDEDSAAEDEEAAR